MVQPLWGTDWRFLKGVSLRLPRDQAIPFLAVEPRELKLMSTHKYY